MGIIRFVRPCVLQIFIQVVSQSISASPKSTWIAAPLSCQKKFHLKKAPLQNHLHVHYSDRRRRVCNRETVSWSSEVVSQDCSISSLRAHWAQAVYLQLTSTANILPA